MRILTWNARGDMGTRSQEKANELSSTLKSWAATDDEVAIVCLQEVNTNSGTLCQYLRQLNWNIAAIDEQDGGGGRQQVIAVHPDLTINSFDVIDLSQYGNPETIPSRPCRTPCCADISLPDGSTFTVATWHATLGSRQEDDLQGFSKYLEILSKSLPDSRIILAADFNCEIGRINDPGLFPDYHGYSCRLDHIIAVNVTLTDGQNSTAGNSDHELVSAHFEL